MTPRSGIAIIHVAPIGLLRLDDGGLRLVRADDPDPKTYPKLEAIVDTAFDLVDGNHVTVPEALRKLPEALGVPAEAIKLISLTDIEQLPPLGENEIS